MRREILATPAWANSRIKSKQQPNGREKNAQRQMSVHNVVMENYGNTAVLHSTPEVKINETIRKQMHSL